MKNWIIFALLVGGVYVFFLRGTHFKASNGQSLEYLKKEYLNPVSSAPNLFMLHGHGANMEDLIPAMTRVNFPLVAYFFNGPDRVGLRGRTWANAVGESRQDWEQKVYEKIEGISQLLSEASLSLTGENKPYLFGFSLGGSVAMHAALKHPGSFAGVFVVGGKALPQNHVPQNDGLFDPPPVWLFHSEEDKVVPISDAQSSLEIFRKKNYPVELIPFAGGHQVGIEVTAKVKEILSKQLFLGGS